MKFFENDMDELFNKAGRHYPLKTEPKNWETVRSALHGDETGVPAKPNRRRYRRWLPLLLLLLIPAAYVYLDQKNVKQNDEADSSTILPTNTVTKDEIGETNNKPDKSSTNQREPNVNQIVKQHQPAIDIESTRREVTTGNKNIKQPIATTRHNTSQQSFIQTKTTRPSTVKAGGNMNEPEVTDDLLSSKKFPRAASMYSVNVPSAMITMKNLSNELVQPNGSASVPKPDKKNTKYKSGFYYGVIAAPDISTIKNQRIKGMGYSAGIIAGYNFNTRLTIEGGVLWSRKKYYTDGKYFTKSGAQIPDYINVHWLDGGCNMFEFPLAVRYNFSRASNTWFAGVGVTSYMMKKENYTYGANAGVSGNYYEGYKSYNRSGDHLFANLQLSGGYKFALSPKINMRIEPYLKAPLKKIGIGKMPVTSTGLYFAITRDIR